MFGLSTLPLMAGLVCCIMGWKTVEEPTSVVKSGCREYGQVLCASLGTTDAAHLVLYCFIFFTIPVVALNMKG